MAENLKKQLAVAVRSIQWRYAICWSPSREPGVLGWGDGYYDGEIKTRKMVHSSEVSPNQFGLERSEQLRELYESLSAGEANQQAFRPSAALSPEDLTDMEWYYLVCMSFTFRIGQSLPGRTLSDGQPIWLSNADCADSKVFSRSLLAKSASIKTVLCLPFSWGVIEVGTTELVLEDPRLIQHIKTTMLEVPCVIVANDCDENFPAAPFGHEIVDAKLIRASPGSSSNEQSGEDSVLFVGENGGPSTIQSCDSSYCKAQAIVDPAVVDPIRIDQTVNGKQQQDIQEGDHSKLTAMRLRSTNLQYQDVLALLFKTSNPLILSLHSQNGSSFVSWSTVESPDPEIKDKSSQNLLKKILFEIPHMHNAGLCESPNHAVLERKRRERLNERFMILKSIVPSISKVDKASILDDTIEYLQKFERRIEELETFAGLTKTTKRKYNNTVERICGNYHSKETGNGKRPFINKRKVHHINKLEQEIDDHASRDNVSVSTNDKEILIEIKCPWREGILLEILNAVSHLQLDTLSVQSSTINETFSMSIKSKKKIVNHVSAGSIKHALHRVAWRPWKTVSSGFCLIYRRSTA